MAHTYENNSYRPAVFWHPSRRGQLSYAYAVSGGNDMRTGGTLYVGRAIHDRDCIPGKVVPSHGVCYVAYGGGEHAHIEYQVLTNPNRSNLVWVSASRGEVPLGAIQGGEQSDGQSLFIVRAFYNGSMVIGNVHPGHKTVHII